MKAALDQFEANLARARALLGFAVSLDALTTTAVDIGDVQRAALVLGVSALDQFVHELVRIGMLEVHRGSRAATDSWLSFKVPLLAVRSGLADPGRDDWLDQAIREAHSWQSFEHPDRIADAVRMLSSVSLWKEVAKGLGSEAAAIKARLAVIVDRRNKIAHEADMDPTNPGHQWPISRGLVEDALSFVDALAHAIDKLVG